jgi:hypothetical protein
VGAALEDALTFFLEKICCLFSLTQLSLLTLASLLKSLVAPKSLLLLLLPDSEDSAISINFDFM